MSRYGRPPHNSEGSRAPRSEGGQYADRVRRLRVALGRILEASQQPLLPWQAVARRDEIAKIAEEALEQERREDG